MCAETSVVHKNSVQNDVDDGNHVTAIELIEKK